MKRETVAAVVGIIFRATDREVTDVTIGAWEVVLAPYGDDGAVEAAAEVVRRFDRPTPAQYIEALTEGYHRRRQRTQLPPPTEPEADPEVAQKWIATIREQLAQIGTPKAGRFRGQFVNTVWHYDDPEAVWAHVPVERRPAGWDRQTPKPERHDHGPPPPRMPSFEELATCRFEGCGLPSAEGDGWCSRHRPKDEPEEESDERL